MDTPKKLFIATNCCTFCHEQFPLHYVPGPDTWQSIVRAIFCLEVEDDGDGDANIRLTKPIYLPSLGRAVNVALTNLPKTETVTIFRKPQVNQECRRDQLALCFHSWCYSVLTWELKDCSVSVIYRLALALAPNPLIWEDIQEKRHDFDSQGRLRMLACHGEQPLLMSNLPIELRTDIWLYTGLMTPYSAFLLVRSEACRLVGRLRSPLSCVMIPPQASPLVANMVSVFGKEYIQDLIVDETCEVGCWSTKDATGLKYIVGIGGVCAIQFFGINWESKWIGKIPSMDSVWHGILRGAVSKLRYDYSDLNYTAMSLDDHSSQNQVVWDQPNFPTTLLDPDASLFDFDRDILQTVSTGAELRFFRYLPFYSKNEYIKGLTVYVARRGIVGLEVHFTRISRLSGHRSGCVLHFSLLPDERIAYVWLRVIIATSSSYAAPVLVIETTRGRRHTFGPYILPAMVRLNDYKWILLRQEGYIAGLYYENVKVGKTIMRLGAIGDDTTQQATPLRPQYHNCVFPSPPIGNPSVGLFLSLAVLQNLERVEMCRVKERCTGLMIHYIGGLTSVLGQWHASCASSASQSCIYDSNGPAVRNIYFQMSKHDNLQIVSTVSFTPLTTATNSDADVRVFRAGEHIAWWFSEKYDEILRWTEELQNIPDECAIE